MMKVISKCDINYLNIIIFFINLRAIKLTIDDFKR
ncbi:hypothetical protein SAMN05444412_103119 [Rhodonellum ikkaensis]|uniref:Uncharacterized protein n=1 Tax=Rhodonellum ikkaensis TaxID=336829 RepID=A0A1H3N6X0_9BACT|nr:hypothetical protein SAMN05444412_103119 [Rhodonellum ikkaensis]